MAVGHINYILFQPKDVSYFVRIFKLQINDKLSYRKVSLKMSAMNNMYHI